MARGGGETGLVCSWALRNQTQSIAHGHWGTGCWLTIWRGGMVGGRLVKFAHGH